ncbi:hypothetical protein Rhopal_007258-T1 [Rhodotorula paludigena]|uniref:FAD-binding FR-type domain-containing protein n=1 Tax=Rhodotorula paludigena TaxID=86838 RepID=A0AAV5GW34_9BASI|nr:hypothetical protein Rhopal_007258-T1 [Rhodotorula paludigena]
MASIAAAALHAGADLVRRHDYSHLTDAQILELTHDPFEESTKYSKAAVICLSSVIGFFGVLNGLKLAVRNNTRITRIPAYQRSVALCRYIDAIQPKALGFIRFPSAGAIALIVAFWLFILIWTFAQQPLYYSDWDLGSAPLAIRAGMFALGCFPFILAFGAKWNIVGFVVGCSPEKLKTFHSWLSHLFRSRTRQNEDGLNPDGLSEVNYSWHVRGMVYYWSGIAAIVPLCWLCWASFAPIRKWSPAFFRYTHYISAILFSAFFYLHCNNVLNSWEYLYAAAGVYFASLAARWSLLAIRNGRKVSRATVELLADDAVRVTVPVTGRKWAAGQHFFVNFFKLRAFDNRPYTVSNAHSVTSDHLTLVFRINPSSGLGPRLLSLAASNASTPVLLDGPYGGPSAARRDLARRETLVLVAGGAGMAHCAAVLEDACARIKRGESVGVKKIHVYWAVRNKTVKSWFDEQLCRATQNLPADLVSFHLFVTGGNDDADSLTSEKAQSELSTEKLKETPSIESGSVFTASTSSALLVPWTTHSGRPALASLLTELFDTAAPGSSIGIASCGPHGLTTDVSRAVAKRQRKIAFQGVSQGVAEVELHTESLDW